MDTKNNTTKPERAEQPAASALSASPGSGLLEWASRKRSECVLKAARPGRTVKYGSAEYEVAHQRDFPQGRMVGIYDDPPSKHVDYINPRNLTVPFQNYKTP